MTKWTYLADDNTKPEGRVLVACSHKEEWLRQRRVYGESKLPILHVAIARWDNSRQAWLTDASSAHGVYAWMPLPEVPPKHAVLEGKP